MPHKMRVITMLLRKLIVSALLLSGVIHAEPILVTVDIANPEAGSISHLSRVDHLVCKYIMNFKNIF